MADIEEHLGVTIDQVDTSLKVSASEFDGKVTYGQKRSNTGTLTLGTADVVSISRHSVLNAFVGQEP